MLGRTDWQFRGYVRRVVDGDTVDVTLDLGFGTWLDLRVRLANINAPETRGEERPRGLAAKAWLAERLDPVGFERRGIVCETVKEHGKFGRYVARVYLLGETVSLNDQLVAAGHAVPASY